MLFNSINFIIFFIVVYFTYRCLQHHKQNILLLVSSYFFYAFWDVRLLFLIIASTVVNYTCAILIAESVIGKKERSTISFWIILSCFLLITLQWKKAFVTYEPSNIITFMQVLISWRSGWIILGVVTSAIIITNLLLKSVTFGDKTRRTVFISLAIIVNLGVLGFFKYYNFFIDNMEWIIRAIHLNPSTFHLNILLPIGISFYTFKGISYCVDVYRGKIYPEKKYIPFAAFIAFFPALLAGPIDRAENLLNQFNKSRHITTEKTIRGVHLFIYGLFKKVVVADGIVRTVTSVFDSTGFVSWLDVVVATFLFTIQIYCDFSGYTDMARGVAKLFGFDLMINFKLPYFSKNPREFWSRWHISLSSWLRDYLYIPLGGNRKGSNRTYRNLMITMVLGGLWHGAGWNFVLWGFYHGVLLCVHRIFTSAKKKGNHISSVGFQFTNGIIFFILTCYGWLLFRAPSLEKILNLSSTLGCDFGNLDIGFTKPRLAAICGLPVLIIIEIIEGIGQEKVFYKKIPMSLWTALYATILFCIAIGLTTESTQFIYMQF